MGTSSLLQSATAELLADNGKQLDDVGAFADQRTAQTAIDAWVVAYNTQRPHRRDS